ncbi:MAG: histidine phosphatase family protein [Desulfovibrionaceae bacterium]|nr:histidine phosphatase family protein [Desulfovibrionaceae bacterium]
MSELWLIRHGQSVSNAGLPTGHPSLSALTDVGRQQAAHVAGALPRAPDRLVVSPYSRAMDTARPIMDRFPDVPVTVEAVQEFTYLGPESYQGTTRDLRRPMIDSYWARCDPLHRQGAGAETFAELVVRVEAFYRRYVEGPDVPPGLTVVCSHGQFIRAVLLRFFGGIGAKSAADPQAMARFRGFRAAFAVPNGAIAGLSVGGRPRVGGFDVSHLPPRLVTY